MKPKRKQRPKKTLMLNTDTHARLRVAAAKQGVTMLYVTEELINEFLKGVKDEND